MALTGGGSLDPGYGLSQGFGRYRFWIAGRQDGDVELETHLVLAERWLEETPRPRFLFLHTYAVHDYLRIGRLAVPPRDAVAVRAARYDDAVRHLDEHLGAFLESLADHGRLSDTVVVLTSDHGEELGEHGIFGHGGLRHTLMSVPLVVAAPGLGRTGDRVDQPVRSVDVTPTILDLAGVEPSSPLDGRSLRPLLDGTGAPRPPTATFYRSSPRDGVALAVGDLKYTFDNDLGGGRYAAEALFDLATDPEERHNLAGGRPDTTTRLRDTVRRLIGDRLAGLAVDLANPTGSHFVGRLELPGLPPASVKSGDPPCACLDILENAIEFDLAPKTRFRFVLELPPPGPVTVRASLRVSGAEAWREHDAVVPTVGESALVLGPDGWHGGTPGDRPPRAGIVVERRGPEADVAVPYELDPELRRRLQALGYLDG